MRAVLLLLLLLLGNIHIVHEEKYMYKFYAVQRWSSYAYSAVNLKVGGVYLNVMLFTNCSFCRRIFCVCDVKTLLCKYSKKKNVFHVHGYYHFHYAGLTCTIIKVSEIFYAKKGSASCL